MISWRWPWGGAATAIVYIDHNMGTAVKDAFVVPDDADAVAASYRRLGDAHTSLMPIDPADARARITQAIAVGEHMVPPFETESWPNCRPMIDWLLRQLPASGTSYVRPEWSQSKRDRLLDQFISSPFGGVAGLTGEQVRGLAEPLVWFACDYGAGDPLRWGPVAVEIVLCDWYPRRVFGTPIDELRLLPEVLAAFAGFAQRR